MQETYYNIILTSVCLHMTFPMGSWSRFLCIYLEVFIIPDIVMLFQLCPLHSNWKKERAQYIRNFCNISYDKKITTNVSPKSLKASFRKYKCKTKEPWSRRISWIFVVFVPNKRETIYSPESWLCLFQFVLEQLEQPIYLKSFPFCRLSLIIWQPGASRSMHGQRTKLLA